MDEARRVNAEMLDGCLERGEMPTIGVTLHECSQYQKGVHAVMALDVRYVAHGTYRAECRYCGYFAWGQP